MADLPLDVDGEDLVAEDSALPLGTVEWSSIDWATSDKLATSLHIHWGTFTSDSRLVETYPVALLAGGFAGVFAIPALAVAPECSPSGLRGWGH